MVHNFLSTHISTYTNTIFLLYTSHITNTIGGDDIGALNNNDIVKARLQLKFVHFDKDTGNYAFLPFTNAGDAILSASTARIKNILMASSVRSLESTLEASSNPYDSRALMPILLPAQIVSIVIIC